MRPTLRTVLCFAVAATAFAGGCDQVRGEVYRTSIEKALHEDALTGTEPTRAHASAMRTVDLTNCPPEFREAYMRHIHAWDERAAVHDAQVKLAGEQDAAAAAGLLATVFGADATPWSDHVRAEQELQRFAQRASADVSSTWDDVEAIASRYGARVPQ